MKSAVDEPESTAWRASTPSLIMRGAMLVSAGAVMHQFWLAGGTTNEVESTWRHMAAMESGEMTRTGCLAFLLSLLC
jgi:hypothetical protein